MSYFFLFLLELPFSISYSSHCLLGAVHIFFHTGFWSLERLLSYIEKKDVSEGAQEEAENVLLVQHKTK